MSQETCRRVVRPGPGSALWDRNPSRSARDDSRNGLLLRSHRFAGRLSNIMRTGSRQDWFSNGPVTALMFFLRACVRWIAAASCALAVSACNAPAPDTASGAPRIVSLDYCADQYVLRFAPRADILALSPDAGKSFSYLRDEAAGLPTVRARTADILLLRPDVVVRSYGGGPNVTAFLERAGIRVVQLGYPETLADLRAETLRVGAELGAAEEARAVTAEMDRRLAALPPTGDSRRRALYLTAGGASAGPGTLMHEALTAAGLTNQRTRAGWGTISLEELALAQPDLLVGAFYHESDMNHWSAAHHPVARAALERLPSIQLDSAVVSCGGWFLLDAIEAMAKARS